MIVPEDFLGTSIVIPWFRDLVVEFLVMFVRGFGLRLSLLTGHQAARWTPTVTASGTPATTAPTIRDACDFQVEFFITLF